MAKQSCISVNGMKKSHARHFSVKDVGFFEGPEKLLEVWFQLPPHDSAHLNSTSDGKESHSTVEVAAGLRKIPRCLYISKFVLHNFTMYFYS